MLISDWSSDVCSSDLSDVAGAATGRFLGADAGFATGRGAAAVCLDGVSLRAIGPPSHRLLHCTISESRTDFKRILCVAPCPINQATVVGSAQSIGRWPVASRKALAFEKDRKSTRLNSSH